MKIELEENNPIYEVEFNYNIKFKDDFNEYKHIENIQKLYFLNYYLANKYAEFIFNKLKNFASKSCGEVDYSDCNILYAKSTVSIVNSAKDLVGYNYKSSSLSNYNYTDSNTSKINVFINCRTLKEIDLNNIKSNELEDQIKKDFNKLTFDEIYD